MQRRKTLCSPSLSLISIQFGSCEVWCLTPASENIWRVSFKQPQQHSHNTVCWRYIFTSYTLNQLYFHVFSKPTNDPTESEAYNCSPTSKHAKLLTVWVWQYTKRHRNCVSNTTNKLRFHYLVPNIWLAGIENGTFDWLDLKMLESIVSVLPFDWFSLSGWSRFQ